MDSPPWLFPKPGYRCIRCGQSCGHWRIWVEPDLLEGIRQHPLSLELGLQGRSPLQETEEGAHLVHSEGGRCHFLGADSLCELHRDLGWESKPRACRQFPFFLHQTPDGIQVGLSFRCTAVRQGQDEDWSQHQSTLDHLWSSGRYPRIGFDPQPFGTTLLDWETYRHWEDGWCRLLDHQPLWQACRPQLEAHLPHYWPEPHLDRQLGLLSAASLGFLQGLDWERLDEFSRQHVDQFPGRHRPEYVPYLRHVLERKTLWWGDSLLAQLTMTLVAERLLDHLASRQDLDTALKRVEGEWLAHRHDLAPLAQTFAQVLLHPPAP